MKKILLVFGCIGILTTFSIIGCGGDKATSPEDFSKTYIAEKFKDGTCDLGDLDYKIIQDGEDTATIEIEGEIEYKEVISLIKQDGKWVLAADAVKAVKEEDEGAKKSEEKADH